MPATKRRLTRAEAAGTNFLDALDDATRERLVERHSQCWHSSQPDHATLNECAADILATRQRRDANRAPRKDARA